MDSFTLIVASAMVGAIMAATMGLLYRASSGRRCLLDWAIAGALFSVNNIVGAFAAMSGSWHALLPAIANTIYIAGHYAVLAGVRRHLGRSPRYDVLAALSLAVFLLHLTPFAISSVAHRLLMFTPVIAAINLSIAGLLWRQPDSEARSSYMPLVVLEVLFMFQLTLRAMYMVASEHTPLTFLGSQFLQTSGSLFVLVFLSVVTMCCALIVLRHQELALRRASLTDALTGWLNRRALHDLAERDYRRARRTGEPLYFITFDIDHFKSVNDRFGHGTGDAAIRRVTELSAHALRGYDALFRIGGEEFAVLINGVSAEDARSIAERLRELVDASPLHIDGHTIALTVSVGLAALEPADHKWEDILRRADDALYHAKKTGRNRVCVSGDDAPRLHLVDRSSANA
ncbi:GGDEF domain-containing protein [Massilia arenosa]|uniref:diguanylate cyclase n=1 Tax=Zemynaea arenosa TaxID=2561931 RepID=A0A4Y9S6E2_9BURK|nr:GGDEF domain-containing protein [Massilia arenosa]TFW17096.1 GGDEF domain-containing protein [Massilia arenosa]